MNTIVSSGLNDPYAIGSPANKGVFFDGTHFWLFYTISGELHCKYGTSLEDLADSPTAASGVGNVVNIRNDGQCYAVCFGSVAGKVHAWCLFSESISGRGYVMVRWELSSTGLANPVEYAASTSDSDRWRASLTTNYSGDVSDLMEFIQTKNSNGNTRYNNEQLNGDLGLGALDSTAIELPEHARVLALSDGYLALAIDQGGVGEQNGNFGHAREWLRPNLSTSWGQESIVEGNVAAAATHDGDFTDQNCAVGTSQVGQQDIVQTADGKTWVAYCDNGDPTSGNYGVVKLLQRGNLQADGWSLISSDVIGGGEPAWHIALSSDGTDLWIVYVKDNSGSRDTKIYYRKYCVAASSFGLEMKLADVQPAHAFQRMFAPWRLESETLVVAWSESDGSTYDIKIGATSTSNVLLPTNRVPHQTRRVAEVQRSVSVN